MTDHADTGIPCSLCAPDARSPRAIALVKRHAAPLAFTWIHQLEFRNALRLRVFPTFDTRQAMLAKAAGHMARNRCNHAAPAAAPLILPLPPVRHCPLLRAA